MSEQIQKKKLQEETEKFTQVQNEYQKAVFKTQQLLNQFNENAMVKKELELLKSGNEVFKLIGPVLIKQELVEAKENVNKRMEYMSTEITKLKESMVSLNEKLEVHREKILKLEQSIQQNSNKSKS